VSPTTYAYLGGQWATDPLEISQDPRSLDAHGRWAVLLPYEGSPVFIRFGTWTVSRPEWLGAGQWNGPEPHAWRSGMSQAEYVTAVAAAREAIARGDIYQVNVCRVLEAELPPTSPVDLLDVLSQGNPSPFSSMVVTGNLAVVSASPELFLRRSHSAVASGPIKGTGRTEAELQDKDSAENVMIVDLVRNDLSRICRTGSVEVSRLLELEEHPGLVHLVSEVVGELMPDTTWPQILSATFPPGSVTGAPKSSALRTISELEADSRGMYCGALGWVDADRQEAELAVAIRTFWMSEGLIRFGTGAGITWASDARQEWQETELKAERLISLASMGAGA